MKDNCTCQRQVWLWEEGGGGLKVVCAHLFGVWRGSCKHCLSPDGRKTSLCYVVSTTMVSWPTTSFGVPCCSYVSEKWGMDKLFCVGNGEGVCYYFTLLSFPYHFPLSLLHPLPCRSPGRSSLDLPRLGDR